MIMSKYDNEKILCVSDLHFPYAHKDSLKFLRAIKKKYKPTRIVLLGDELDYHALSFHNSDPDLDSAGPELVKALGYMQTLYTIFPSADVMESNHGSMAYRKAKHHGMPRHLLKSYKEVLAAPSGWKWHRKLILTLPTKLKVMFVHGYRKNSLMESQKLGMSFVQGHHHSTCEIRYWKSEEQELHFGMTVGCSIDDDSMAYEYNKLNSSRPVINHSIILNGVPRLIPMYMTKSGRWDGVVH